MSTVPLGEMSTVPLGEMSTVSIGRSFQPITDSRSFARLHAEARVVRSGPLVLRVLDDGFSPPRLGFALGRKFGNAVSRNRARRRLQHAFSETVNQHQNLSGTFLIGARREVTEASFEDLCSWLDKALQNFAKSVVK